MNYTLSSLPQQKNTQTHTKGIFTHILASTSSSLLIFYLTSSTQISECFTRSVYRVCAVSVVSLASSTLLFFLFGLAIRGIGDALRKRGKNAQNNVGGHLYTPISSRSSSSCKVFFPSREERFISLVAQSSSFLECRRAKSADVRKLGASDATLFVLSKRKSFSSTPVKHVASAVVPKLTKSMLLKMDEQERAKELSTR